MFTDEAIARVCHAANERITVHTPCSWDDLPETVKAGVIAGVQFIRANPQTTPVQIHDRWVDSKIADGYAYGPKKDTVQKTHPNMISFGELPEIEKIKDVLFIAIVAALDWKDE